MENNTTSTPVIAQMAAGTSNYVFGSENLDTKAIFRRLVTNQFMHGFDYSFQTFSFKTVFYQTHHSYCCCPCAFEHEYVSDNGSVSEEICEKILECILTGHCPHVEDVPNQYITETKIKAVHIAAAAKTTLSLRYFYEPSPSLESSVFKLLPETVAIFHNNLKFVNQSVARSREWQKYSYGSARVSSVILYAQVQREKEYKIVFESITQPDFCLRTHNNELLQFVLDPIWSQCRLDKTLEQCFGNPELADIQNIILEHLRTDLFQFRIKALSECVLSAIVCDEDSVLRSLLDILDTRTYSDDLTVQLPNICDVLCKNHQKQILHEYGYKGQNMVDGDHFHLLHYLRKNHADKLFKQIEAAFDELSTDQKAINKVYNNTGGLTPLHCAVSDMKSKELDLLLNMGSDIDLKNKRGQTPINLHLQSIHHWDVLDVKQFREILAILLFENPDVQLNKSAVEDGIKADEYFKKRTSSQTFAISGTYIMDCQEHHVFSRNDGYELNFIAPLLIECGFMYSRMILSKSVEKPLDSAEICYFYDCLNNPRSLQITCRNTLRKHFKNRAIHTFVKLLEPKIPKHIQDFILIKHILEASKNFL